LHYQIRHSQGKLVPVVRGAVFDVAVDLRRSSPTFGKWVGVELTEDNYRQLWVPPGFAHGFYVVSDCADFLYKTTYYYFPQHECSPFCGMIRRSASRGRLSEAENPSFPKKIKMQEN
jgi:dTDP-4-dehydrorhamnose 3,5-epimerase